MPLDQSAHDTIAKLEAKLAPLEEQIAPIMAEIRRWRVAINMICEAADEPPRYQIEDGAKPAPAASARRPYGRSEFYDKPLATVVRRILDDCGALDIEELYEIMLSGGFNFTAATPEKAKNNLKISLGKNMKFGRTPNGHYLVVHGTTRGKRNGSAAPHEDDGDYGDESETDDPEESLEERAEVS